MKKFLSLFFGCLIVLLVFAAPGQSAKAAEKVSTEEMLRIDDALGAGVIPSQEHSEGCGCEDATQIQGSERNKIVAEVISSGEFNYVKQQAKGFGYKWSGAGSIEVMQIKFGEFDVILVGAPFVTKDGNQVMFGFVNGIFKAITSL